MNTTHQLRLARSRALALARDMRASGALYEACRAVGQARALNRALLKARKREGYIVLEAIEPVARRAWFAEWMRAGGEV